MPDAADLFRQWRAADRAAHDFGQWFVTASMLSLSGHGPAPTPEDRERAKELRATSHVLFRLTMDEMKRQAHAASHSRH